HEPLLFPDGSALAYWCHSRRRFAPLGETDQSKDAAGARHRQHRWDRSQRLEGPERPIVILLSKQLARRHDQSARRVQRVSATANCVSDVTADSLRPYRLPVLSLDKRDDVAMKGASTEVLEACWFLDEVRSIRANDVANLDCTGGGFEGMVRSAYAFTSAFPCLNDVVRMSATRLEQAILPAMRAAA